MSDPNVEMLEVAAYSLRPVLRDLVLVGGCAVGLLITDRGRPPVRHTVDVDVVAEVTPLSNYYKLCDQIRELGFRESPEVICRWTKNGITLDVMSTDKSVLGFSNQWYELVVKFALTSTLPNGLVVRHVSAPLLIATKIESFYGRGEGNFLHHDIEDIINLVDGRPEIVSEVRDAPQAVQQYIEQEIDDLLGNSQFVNAIPMLLSPDLSEQARVPIILGRLRQLAGL
jgi:hypothetical protein